MTDTTVGRVYPVRLWAAGRVPLAGRGRCGLRGAGGALRAGGSVASLVWLWTRGADR